MCLIKNEFQAEDIAMDKDGRAIIFEIGGITFGNLYVQSGTDDISRGKRENCFTEVLPPLLINHKQHGLVGVLGVLLIKKMQHIFMSLRCLLE